MFLSKKCKNTHRKPISIKKSFVETEKLSEIKEEEVKIVTNEELFEDKEETITFINEKIEGDSIEETVSEETVSKEDLKKKTKKKNNKE